MASASDAAPAQPYFALIPSGLLILKDNPSIRTQGKAASSSGTSEMARQEQHADEKARMLKDR